MTLFVLMLVGAAAGLRVGRWWMTGRPLALGAVWGLLLVATGDRLTDSPIAFVVGVSTVAVAAGVAFGRRPTRSAS
jgi:hypothetical protein